MTSFEPIAAAPSSRQAALPQPSRQHSTFSDPNRLAPEDAFLATSPLRQQKANSNLAESDNVIYTGSDYGSKGGRSSGRKREKSRGRSGSRRRKGEWKKLLWVRHPGCTYAIT